MYKQLPVGKAASPEAEKENFPLHFSLTARTKAASGALSTWDPVGFGYEECSLWGIWQEPCRDAFERPLHCAALGWAGEPRAMPCQHAAHPLFRNPKSVPPGNPSFTEWNMMEHFRALCLCFSLAMLRADSEWATRHTVLCSKEETKIRRKKYKNVLSDEVMSEASTSALLL